MTLTVALFLAPLTLLTFCFAVEIFAGIRPLRQTAVTSSGRASAVIIVPAHDEEPILGDRLISLKAAVGDRDRILVIADNCLDRTAEIARSLEVDVLERADPQRRGKGFAIDFARQHLEAAPPAVVLIFDADCWTDADSLDRLIWRCMLTGSPSQATYLLAPRLEGSSAVQLSTFAFYIKNVVRQRALQRLAGRAHLLGTGMALPWPVFARADLATDNIVEDLKLGQELAEAGHAPLFVEEAKVWSTAETERNTLSQRRRWEGGFLENAVRVAPKFLVRSLARGDVRNVWAAINLMIPPFAFLVLLDIAAMSVAGAATWFTGADGSPLILLAAALMLAILALAVAWRTGGSRFVTLKGLARVPRYLLWKLPLYLGFAQRGPPKDWVRTSRDEV